MNVIVIGGGGHAKVLIGAMSEMGLNISGVVDSNDRLIGTQVSSVPVVGTDKYACGCPPDETVMAMGIGSTSSNSKRSDIFQFFRAKGFLFQTVVHPSAVIGLDVELGEGAQVMAMVVVQPGAKIGDNVILNTACSIDHDCRIGHHTHISPGATLSGEVIVGENTHVGAGAVIVQGVRIGDGCMINAGAIVTRDIPDGHKVSHR